jgi:ATP-binding cassette, subfamily C (CFTR/MRP), member 4
MESLYKQKKLPKCPSENASLISYLTFSWILEIFFKGRKQTLGLDDLYQPLKQQKSDSLGNDLENALKKNSSLFSSFVEVFGFKIVYQGLILLSIECVIKILPPIFLSNIINFYSKSEEKSQVEAVWYTIGIIVAIFLNVFISHAFNVTNLNLGIMMKTGLSSVIYRKCLKLSKLSVGNITTGKIVNMMSTDVGK